MKKLNSEIFKSMLFACVLPALTVAAAVIISVIFVPEYELKETVWYIIIIALLSIAVGLTFAFFSAKRLTEPIEKSAESDAENNPYYAEMLPLYEKIRERDRKVVKQFRDMNEEHDRQDAMRRDFTANVSHELKTPLTSISGYAELIKTGIAKKEDIEGFAGKIYDESQRLITLVGDIIKLSQLDGKDISVSFEEIDLLETCRAVADQLQMSASEKNVTVSVTGEPIKINTAGLIVEEIIFNICDNAVKYNREGGRVDVSVHQRIDGVELCVSDTGIGIPKEDINRIFERFYRVDKSHSKKVGGTGLGLSIVKHGAKFLGAGVSVTSECDKGTTVRVLF